jgi:hypothetical protein
MKRLPIFLLFALCQYCYGQQPIRAVMVLQPSISYNQPIAINIKGGGYLKYSYREYGVSLRWHSFPIYEWVIRNGNKTGPVDFTQPFQLYNTRINRYLVYSHQNYGINMNWSNADLDDASREWIFQGNAIEKNPSGQLTNNVGSSDHYVKYGERTWGVNLVWSQRPSIENIQFVAEEIHPADIISKGGTWKFANFNTAHLSWQTFIDAFDIDWNDEDTYNPMTPVIFLFGRGALGSSGNCFGMCLAEELIAERNTTALPYFGRIQEPIWDHQQYPDNDKMRKAINYFHWKQLSTEFLTPWVHGLGDSYSSIVNKIQADLQHKTFGLLSIYKNFSFDSHEGHVVVPYRVRKIGADEYHVYIHDVNSPALSLQDTSRKLVIRGSTMKYGTDIYDEMSYVTYKKSSSYENLMNSLFDIAYVILGEGTELEQVSDDAGNNLFVTRSGSSMAKTRSNNKLASSITPFPGLGRGIGDAGFVEDTTIKDKMLRDFLERKQQQFGAGSKCFLVHDLNLNNIKITVKGTGNKPVVVEAGNKQESVLVSATKKNPGSGSITLTVSQFRKPSSSLIMTMKEDALDKITVEKTNKNNLKNGIDITTVEVPAKDNMISMNFGNADVLAVKSAKQKQELNVTKTQLLRTGQRTNSMYKVQMQ